MHQYKSPKTVRLRNWEKKLIKLLMISPTLTVSLSPCHQVVDSIPFCVGLIGLGRLVPAAIRLITSNNQSYMLLQLLLCKPCVVSIYQKSILYLCNPMLYLVCMCLRYLIV